MSDTKRPTDYSAVWATYLQAIQLVDAIGQMLPQEFRPHLSPGTSARIKAIELNCREIHQYLERKMDAENMEEFLDKNAELYNFMKAFHSLTYEQRDRMVKVMQEQVTQPTTTTTDNVYQGC